MTNSETTYQVTGMTCGGCARSVRNALERVLPGQVEAISHEDDTVTVSGAHDPRIVEEAVSGAGFRFGGAT